MTQQLHLACNRVLEYLQAGAPDGFPVIFIHGTPGGCVLPPSLRESVEKRGLNLISVTRPGYGRSTRAKGRSVVDIVKDIGELLAHLNIDKCAVMGWSGGGPHAIACAAQLPACRAVLSIAGVGPYGEPDLDFLAGQGEDNIMEYGIALEGEEQLQLFCKAQREQLADADAEAITQAMSTILPDVDKKALQASDLGAFMVESFNHALKSGCDGWVDDDFAFIKPWGFKLSDVKVPVLVYQGSVDLMVPYAHGQWLAKHLPQDKVVKHLFEDQGHLSIFVDYMEQMLDELLSVAQK